MRMTTLRVSLFTCGLILHPAVLWPQTPPCQGVDGPWVGGGPSGVGYAFSLSQTGTTISGTVDTGDCGDPGQSVYDISGSINTSGTLTVNATANGDNVCPASAFTYTGTLAAPGCNTGSGTWTNNISGSGSWSWSKPCDQPTSETTTTTGGSFGTSPSDKSYFFQVTLQSTSGLLFGGRTLSESDGGSGTDGCYASWSIYDPFNTVPSTSVVADWTQGYADLVGWHSNMSSYYQTQRQARSMTLPCGFVLNQNVNIACSSSSVVTYQTNQISSCVTSSQQIDCRPGYCYNSTGTCVSTSLP